MVGPSGGAFTVQLDEGLLTPLNATSKGFSSRVVLYQNSGLGPGVHTMRVMNTPFSGQTLSIDYAVIWRS
jgi:hypothetical protein